MSVDDVEVPLQGIITQGRSRHPFRNVCGADLGHITDRFLAGVMLFPRIVDKARSRARYLIIAPECPTGSVGLYGATSSYLYRLYDGLIDKDDAVACAARTAFTLFSRQATSILRIRLTRLDRIGEFPELGRPHEFDNYDHEEVIRILDSQSRGLFLKRYEQFYRISLSWGRAITYFPSKE